MSHSTLAEYRNLYRDRHGISCPLSDAQIRTAFAAVSPTPIDETKWPLELSGLTAMEEAVADNFPEVDQGRWQMGGTFAAPQDLVLDNETDEGFDVNFSLPTGGNLPYSIQLQLAPDDEGEPGEWANEGAAQDDDTEIVVAGLTAETIYHARLICTDNLGETGTSNVESTETLAGA